LPLKSVRCSVLEDQPKDLLVTLSRCAKARITLRAKCGVWLTRKRNCFSETGNKLNVGDRHGSRAVWFVVNQRHFTKNAVSTKVGS
jgi:hypothetical protein